MTQLHEVLAVEGDKEQRAKEAFMAARSMFAAPDRFVGQSKVVRMLAEGAPEQPEEHREYSSTVTEVLKTVLQSAGDYYDVVFQKEATNQDARSDLAINGQVLVKDAPATFLLGMEKRLKLVREIIGTVPTLPPGVEVEPAPDRGPGVFKVKHADKRHKTQKTFKHKVLYDATDRHPAEIEKWEEQEVVGIINVSTWYTVWPEAVKNMVKARIDALIEACLLARQKANGTEVARTDKPSEAIVSFLLKDIE